MPSAALGEVDESKLGAFDALKRSMFGVFHMMREKVGGQPTSLQQVWALLLIIVDVVQVLALPVGAPFRWSRPTIEAFEYLSAVDAVVPDDSSRSLWFSVLYLGGLLLVIIALATAAHVANMFRKNDLKQLWVLKFLRAAVGIIITAGFVPVTRLLATPFNCDRMQSYYGPTFECGGIQHLGQVIISLTLLLAYIPFGLTCSLVFHDSNSTLPVITAKVSGKEAMLGTIAKLMGIAMIYVAGNAPGFASLVMATIYMWLAAYTAFTLPFFNKGLNSLKCAACLGTACTWMGAFVLTAVPEDSDFTLLSVVIMAGALPAALIAGALLPFLQYKRIRKMLGEVRPQMLAALQEHHAQQAAWGMMRREKRSEQHARKLHIARLARNIQKVQVQSRQALHLLNASDMADPDSTSLTVFNGLNGFEVELLIREEMSKAAPTRVQKGCRGCRRRLLGRVPKRISTRVVEHVLWLFTEAAQEFADSAGELAVVKIEYAKFLQVFTADTSMAMAALEEAARQAPSIEGEFDIFSRQRSLIQKKQSHNLGTDHSMNMIELLEYGKGLNQALKDHRNALANLRSAAGVIVRTREAGGSEVIDPALDDKVGVLLERMARDAKHAGRTYRKLLAAHPTAPYLAPVYARFCSDVLNDPALGARYSASSNPPSHSGGTSRSIASDTHIARYNRLLQAPTCRAKLPKPHTRDVRKLMARYSVLGWLWVTVVIVSTILSTILVGGAEDRVEPLVDTGRLATLLVRSNLHARRLCMGSVTPEVLNATRSTVAEMKRVIFGTQAALADESDLSELWLEPSVNVTTLTAPGTYVWSLINLRDAANRVAADLITLAAKAEAGQLSYASALASREWRFVMMNTVPRMLPAVYSLMRQQLEELREQHEDFIEAQQPFLLMEIGFTLLIILLIVISAVLRLRSTKHSVFRIAAMVPTKDLRLLRKKCTSGIAFVKQTGVMVAHTIDENSDHEGLEDEERGLDHVSARFDEHNGLGLAKIAEEVNRQSQRGMSATPTRAPESPFTPHTPHTPTKGEAEELTTPTTPQLPGAVPARPTVTFQQPSSAGKRRRRSSVQSDASSAASSVQSSAAGVPQASGAANASPTGAEGADEVEVIPTLRDIMNACPATVLCTNEVGDITFASKSLRKLLGYSSRSIVGHNVTTFQEVTVAVKHRSLMKRALQGESKMVGMPGRQLTGVSKQGGSVKMLVAASKLVNVAGEQRADMRGRTFFVADMHDLRRRFQHEEHVATQHGSRIASARGRVKMLVQAVLCYLVIIGLHIGAMYITTAGLDTLSNEASQAAVGQQMLLSAHLTVLGGVETVVGDGVMLDSPQGAAQFTVEVRDSLKARHEEWFYGNPGTDVLPPYADAVIPPSDYPLSRLHFAQDVLQFGLRTVNSDDDLHDDDNQDEVIVAPSIDRRLGVVGRMHTLDRNIMSIVLAHNRTYSAASVTSSWSGVASDESMKQLLADVESPAAGAEGVTLRQLLTEALELALSDMHDSASDVHTYNVLLHIGTILLGLLVTKFAFKRVAYMLLSMARRAEYFLLTLPPHLTAKGAPAAHYFRAAPASTYA